MPDIDYVGVEDVSGETLAGLGSSVRLSDDLDLTEPTSLSFPIKLLWTRSVQISTAIEDGGRQVGRIVLAGNTAGLLSGLRSMVLTVGAGATLAMLTGLVIAWRLQRGITRPLIQLSSLMRSVQSRHDYSVVCDIRTDDEVGALSSSFNAMMNEIREREREVIFRLAKAGEYRDTDTGEHVHRVAGHVRRIAEAMSLDAGECERLALASTMHDIGKIGVPDAILLKPGRLTDDERVEMNRHTEWAHMILSGGKSELINLAAEIALTHHEKWDGGGYPHGLAGEAIPLSGRIVAVADVFDALVSERPYKKAWSFQEAKDLLIKEAGRHFDPACVKAFLSTLSREEADAPARP